MQVLTMDCLSATQDPKMSMTMSILKDHGKRQIYFTTQYLHDYADFVVVCLLAIHFDISLPIQAPDSKQALWVWIMGSVQKCLKTMQ